ncbi:hypothetical protein GGI12_003897 [Dipsacomyces acuminosporus]|nr:hypothetical protein GGI12_003897 [Dipsacomyces acuminosporus]
MRKDDTVTDKHELGLPAEDDLSEATPRMAHTDLKQFQNDTAAPASASASASSSSDDSLSPLNTSQLVAHRQNYSHGQDGYSLIANEDGNGGEYISLTPTHSQGRTSHSGSSSSSRRSSSISSFGIINGRQSLQSEGSGYAETIDNVLMESIQSLELRHKPAAQIIREIIIEVIPALLISVAGSVIAGYILGKIQKTPAFDKIPALFIMIPVLLNLKSNIELNMSTRLSTQANMGVFDNKAHKFKLMRSNMELLLLQSIIIGACVGLVSALLSLIPGGGKSGKSPLPERGFLVWVSESSFLLASGVGSAAIGSGAIGLLTCFTVAVSHRFGVDPDNIGTPIASSFGDLSTLMILSALSGLLIRVIGTAWPWALVLVFLGFGAFLLTLIQRDDEIAHHIKEGWLPLVYAGITSSIAGIIVEKCAARYPGMPALVPVLNGIGGNIGTVFSARLSTSLHRKQSNAVEHNLVMFILLVINIPIQIGFLATHKALDPSSLTISLGFCLLYTTATIIHALAILLLSRAACNFLWSRGYDPDDYVNPFVTGSGDLLGTSLLALVFLCKG